MLQTISWSSAKPRYLNQKGMHLPVNLNLLVTSFSNSKQLLNLKIIPGSHHKTERSLPTPFLLEIEPIKIQTSL